MQSTFSPGVGWFGEGVGRRRKPLREVQFSHTGKSVSWSFFGFSFTTSNPPLLVLLFHSLNSTAVRCTVGLATD